MVSGRDHDEGCSIIVDAALLWVQHYFRGSDFVGYLNRGRLPRHLFWGFSETSSFKGFLEAQI